jgi:hypothetical protein
MTRREDGTHDEPQVVHLGLCLAALLVVLLPLPPTSAQSPARFTGFPGAVRQLPSPTGSFLLVNKNLDLSHDPPHRLALVDQRSSRTIWSHGYERSAEAGWSEDGELLVINDFYASDFSRVFVVRIDKKDRVHVVDVSAALEKSGLATKELKRADHCYLEALRWLAADRLLVHLWGYGTILPNETHGLAFSHCYEYTVGAGFRVTTLATCRAAGADGF